MTYRGGCHCGRNRFEIEGDLQQVMECNCSICTMRGYLHWSVPREKLRLLTPESNLAAYTFKTGTVKHHFCPNCGSSVFWEGDRGPDYYGIAVGCFADPDFPAPIYSAYEDAKHRWFDTTSAKEHFPGPRPAGLPVSQNSPQ